MSRSTALEERLRELAWSRDASWGLNGSLPRRAIGLSRRLQDNRS